MSKYEDFEKGATNSGNENKTEYGSMINEYIQKANENWLTEWDMNILLTEVNDAKTYIAQHEINGEKSRGLLAFDKTNPITKNIDNNKQLVSEFKEVMKSSNPLRDALRTHVSKRRRKAPNFYEEFEEFQNLEVFKPKGPEQSLAQKTEQKAEPEQRVEPEKRSMLPNLNDSKTTDLSLESAGGSGRDITKFKPSKATMLKGSLEKSLAQIKSLIQKGENRVSQMLIDVSRDTRLTAIQEDVSEGVTKVNKKIASTTKNVYRKITGKKNGRS